MSAPRRLVRMIKLTQQREITPYKCVHPDEDDRRCSSSRGFFGAIERDGDYVSSAVLKSPRDQPC
jgi:hypothetical protein